MVANKVLLTQSKDQWYRENILKNRDPVTVGLERLYELKQKHGFMVRLVILPWFYKSFDQYPYRQMHEKIHQIARNLPGIEIIEVLEDFQNLNNDASVFSIGDSVHMNSYGNEVLAKILYKKLKNTF